MVQLASALLGFATNITKAQPLDILPPKRQTRAPVTRTRKPRQLALPAGSITQKSIIRRKQKVLRRNLLKFAIVAVNVGILGLVGYMVFVYSGSQSTSYGVHSIEAEDTSNPLDTLSAAEVAVNIAKMTGLPEELAVTNQANTIDLYLNAAISEQEYVTKGQILSASIKSKQDITSHAVVAGDTLQALATQYGVTSDSIKWSNDLRTDQLVPGTTLTIPPVTGIVYTVGVGDTPDKLAETYNANAAEITAFNDAEVTGLTMGEKIVIPNGTKQRMPVFLKFKANYGQNGYWRGYCTWYVATKIAVPNNWGNANTWDNFARVTSGWTVSSTPVVGAIAQSNSGPEGHVAIVEAVSDDGTMIKYSDMNGLAGWGVEGRTPDWVVARQKFQNFIYKTN